jgi:hypothetical protein
MCGGSYVSCPPLLRTALDCIAAQQSLARDNFSEYEGWLDNAVSQATEHQALSIDLGRYRAGSVLSEDAKLGSLYRLLTDLSMPHFGSTALQVGPEAGLQKLSLAFADTTFHLGYAQLVCGWLLILAVRQLQTVQDADVISLGKEAQSQAASIERNVSQVLTDVRRCRVEEIDGRFLFYNFRRTASGQPKRLML